MNDEGTGLEIINNLDQPVPLGIQDKAYREVDKLLEKSLEERDPIMALSGVRQLLRITRISGLALSKLLWSISERWNDYDNNGEKFRDTAFTETGLALATIDRYCAVWDLLVSNEIPNDYIEDIKAMPMRNLVQIAALHTQGYDVASEDWAKMAHAEDGASLSSIIREIKGKPARKSSLQIYLDRNGDLTAYSNGIPHLIGYLKLDEPDEAVQKAIQRLCKSAGVIER